MSVKDPDRLPVELIGSPAFFPALLHYIRAAAGSSPLPLDEVVVRSILLCLIAGNKNLILRTPEEDIGLVVKVVVWTLSYLLNYPTQKVKLRSYSNTTSASAFLWSLFLPSQHTNGSQEEFQRRPSKGGKSANRGHDYARSSSYPNDLPQAPSSIPHRNTSDLEVSLRVPWSTSMSPPAAPIHAFTDPTPSRPPHHAPDHNDSVGRLEFPEALVLSGLEKSSQSIQRALIQMLSKRGLSQADLRDNDPSQPIHPDEDLAWPLPPGFIMIYVCPIDTKERPAIHQSLLDRFAMSHNIQISQSVRYALRSNAPFSAHSGQHSNANSPSLGFHSPLPQTSPLSQPFTPPHFTKNLPSPSIHRQQSSASSIFPQPLLFQPHSDRPVIVPKWFIETLRHYHQKAYFPPQLDLYLSDLFSAVRHHPKLDGLLLTAAARKDAEDLARAARVLGADLTGMELLRPPGQLVKDDIEEKDDDEGEDDGISEYYSIHEHGINDPSTIQVLDDSPQFSRKLHMDESTTHLLGADSATAYMGGLSYLRSPGGKSDTRTTTTIHPQKTQSEETALTPQAEVEALGVTEADVARMMPRAVTHRLRLRDGPEEEVLASAVFGATFNNVPPRIPGGINVRKDSTIVDDEKSEALGGEGGIIGFEHEASRWVGYGSLGIKEILVDILNKV